MGAPRVYPEAGKPFTTRIRPEARAAAERVARRQGRSLGRIVADALELYVAAADPGFDPFVTGPEATPALFEHAQAS